ncbi:MAG: hypothetical protein J4G13_07440 [Dehalococcoidia bacterium]|nr:hypothetical protein [Dehalococcoidia bacterium]
MPPRNQNRTFHIRRNNPHRLGTQDDLTRDGTPPPIVSVAVGTAGYKRSWRWAKRMGEAGVLDRVQSLTMYDCNQGTIDSIDSETRAMRRVRGGHLPVIVPGFLPKVDGFLRDPNAYKDFFGLIHRDMERMVDTIARRAEEVGSPPQLILEWLGFGGHAKLGGVLHGMLMDRFPEATVLPIVLTPSEAVLKENMRRETWGAYEETIGTRVVRDTQGRDEVQRHPALITDNSLSLNFERLDDKLAIALASMEAGMRYQVDAGSMAETVTSFGNYSNGWFGVRVLNRRVDIADTRQGSRLFGPFRGREIVVVNDSAKQLPFAIKSAMWDVLDPKRSDLQLAKHGFVETDSVMRMVITLPVEPEGLGEIAADVQDQMAREEFNVAYPNLMWSFASANFQQSPDDRHMHVTLFYPLQTINIPSITDIMGEESIGLQTPANLPYAGFGSRYFMPPVNGHDGESQYGYVSRGQQIRLERERNRTATAEQQLGNGYGNGASGDYRR